MGNGKWEIRGKTRYRYQTFHGLNRAFAVFKCGTGTAGNGTGFPKYPEISLSYTESHRISDRIDLLTYIKYTVPYCTRIVFVKFSALFNTMLRLIEGAHVSGPHEERKE